MHRFCVALLIITGLATPAVASSPFSFLSGSGSSRGTVQPCSFESLPALRPNASEGATEVRIGVRVLDLIQIDDVQQSMTLDFVVFAAWQDDNVASRLKGQPRCLLSLHSIWNPGLMVAGERNLEAKLEEEVVVASDGGVTYLQRYIGSLRATANLRDFPTDSRTLTVQLVAPGESPDDVQFVPALEHMGFQPDSSAGNWIFGAETSEVTAYSVGGLGARASFAFSIEASRRSGAYSWRLGLPILLIILMSWLPFWIPPVELGTRNSLAALAMLNMIAFQLVLRSMLPAVPYLTLADWVATVALMMIFLALVTSTATGVLALRGKDQLAHVINRTSRLAFPAVTLTFAVLLLSR